MTNILVAKQCSHCSNAMHIHKNGDKDPILTGCAPCIVDIHIVEDKDTLLIKGKQSSKAVRCIKCVRKHLLSSFEEVKDGLS